MKVSVSDIVAVNPSVLRISVYTYTGDLNSADDYKQYELAIPIEEFVTKSEGKVDVDGVKFQTAVSQRIVAAQDVANLAVYMENLQLEWELVPTEVTVTETVDNGLSLAYGDVKE